MMRKSLVTLALVLATGWASASERVQVGFADVQKFADFGRSTVERERNQRHFTAMFEAALADLPKPVRVTVLDVNLAGEIEWMRRGGEEVRVMRNVTWPTIEFEYQLEGEAAKKVKLSDMAYLQSNFFSSAQQAELFRYERRMLDRWVVETFGKR